MAKKKEEKPKTKVKEPSEPVQPPVSTRSLPRPASDIARMVRGRKDAK